MSVKISYVLVERANQREETGYGGGHAWVARTRTASSQVHKSFRYIWSPCAHAATYVVSAYGFSPYPYAYGRAHTSELTINPRSTLCYVLAYIHTVKADRLMQRYMYEMCQKMCQTFTEHEDRKILEKMFLSRFWFSALCDSRISLFS